jgi:hypothetical protein
MRQFLFLPSAKSQNLIERLPAGRFRHGTVTDHLVDVLAHFDRIAIGVTRRWPKVRIECGGKR